MLRVESYVIRIQADVALFHHGEVGFSRLGNVGDGGKDELLVVVIDE